MSRRFQTANREVLLLRSPSIDDWVEEEHLVRFLADCVEQFDLSRFYQPVEKLSLPCQSDFAPFSHPPFLWSVR